MPAAHGDYLRGWVLMGPCGGSGSLCCSPRCCGCPVGLVLPEVLRCHAARLAASAEGRGGRGDRCGDVTPLPAYARAL